MPIEISKLITVTNSESHGITVSSSSLNITIISNTLHDNSWAAIHLGSATASTVVGNIVTNNINFGIVLDSTSSGCLLWGNFLAGNGINAHDESGTNSWDNNTHGNWWSDYGGPDWNHDGIGDIPYSIPGGTGAQDLYPLFNVTDSTLPTVNAPGDVSYEAGTTGHTLAWQPADTHPYWFNITMDGTLMVDQDWDGAGISLNIDGLAVGTHTYILAVYDQLGNSASDSVMVNVTEAPPASSEPSKSESESESDSSEEEPSRTSPGFTVSVLLSVGISFLIVRSRSRRK